MAFDISLVVIVYWSDSYTVFARKISVDALPPVGTIFYFSDDEKRTEDPLQVEIESIGWFESESMYTVYCENINLMHREKENKDIAWMKACGFTPIELDRRH